MNQSKSEPTRRAARLRAWTAIAVLAGSLAAPETGVAQQSGPELVAYRFWRAPAQTLVEVFATVPWSALTFEQQGADERAIYGAVFQVKDSTGAVLMKNEWQDTIATIPLTPASRARASSTVPFNFRVAKGRYTLEFTVSDPKTGRSATATETLIGLATAPETSDLVLAAAIDEADAEGNAPPGSLVRGELAVLPNLQGAVTSDHGKLGILAEIYRPQATAPETAQVVVKIDGTGASTFHYQTPPQTRVFQGGGVDALALDLQGLPPGAYTLTAEWALGGDTVRAQHALRMLPPGAGQVAYAEELPYDGMSEAQVDSVYAPMRYILSADQEVAYEVLASVDAKRRFLAQFWQQQARRQGGSAQELREEWEKRVDYANLKFEKPGNARSKTYGWQSDRGRIYLTFGPPAETLQERQRQDQMNPWEAWKYISGRGDKYVFWDQTGFGDYILVYSSNPEEPGMPGWEQFFTQDAVNQIKRW